MTQGFFCGNKEWKVTLKPYLVVNKLKIPLFFA